MYVYIDDVLIIQPFLYLLNTHCVPWEVEHRGAGAGGTWNTDFDTC